MMSEQFYSLEEINKHNIVDDAWIVVNDIIYDISDFLSDPSQHPGGIDLIKEHLGEDVSVSNGSIT